MINEPSTDFAHVYAVQALAIEELTEERDALCSRLLLYTELGTLEQLSRATDAVGEARVLRARVAEIETENANLLAANRDCITWYEDAKAHMDCYHAALEEIRSKFPGSTLEYPGYAKDAHHIATSALKAG